MRQFYSCPSGHGRGSSIDIHPDFTSGSEGSTMDSLDVGVLAAGNLTLGKLGLPRFKQ